MKDFSVDIKQNKRAKTAEVVLEGQLNISNIDAIKKELDKITASKKIDITITKVDDLDVSFIQIIQAFKTKCKANKIELNLKSDVNEDLDLLLTRAGLQNII